MKKLSKTEIQENMVSFFKDVKNKSAKDIKKLKKTAMSQNISLGEKRKLFCKKCFAPYSGKEKIRINHGKKNVECLNCRKVARWKIR